MESWRIPSAKQLLCQKPGQTISQLQLPQLSTPILLLHIRSRKHEILRFRPFLSVSEVPLDISVNPIKQWVSAEKAVCPCSNSSCSPCHPSLYLLGARFFNSAQSYKNRSVFSRVGQMDQFTLQLYHHQGALQRSSSRRQGEGEEQNIPFGWTSLAVT